ncbi:twin-arginine translocase subunit TatC [Allohahella marinimesophila]|uniref:Sec-independent protein translocase protein TatC n=1 Tax=Allohahella marinimesophila TaxID=1054972 RepID=A0ABP7PKH2_9GAMM
MTDESDMQESGEQSLVSHLVELRDRLLRCVLSIAVCFIPLYAFANELYAAVSEPLRAALPPNATMIATNVASPFLAPFKLTLFTAFFVAVPYILYQIWSFIAPALYQKEKGFAIPLLITSVLLFYAGVAFAYFVVFPLAFAFFASTSPEGVAMMTDINSYLDFILKMFFAFGVAFEIPVATILLLKTGLTSIASLKEKRPYIIVGCFVVGMVLTPPDVISQTLLAVPMWLLYEAGIFFARHLGIEGSASDEQPSTP